jgi:hypothetical protein
MLTKPVKGTYVEYIIAEIDVTPLPKYKDIKAIRVSKQVGKKVISA